MIESHVFIRVGFVMVKKIVLEVMMNYLLIVKMSHVDQISFNVMIDLVFRDIFTVLVKPNVQMEVMKLIAVSYFKKMLGSTIFYSINDQYYIAVPVQKCDQKTQFDCGGGMCIPLSKVCDGRTDCPHFQDEPNGKCNVNECLEKNGGCEHSCVDTPAGFYCECRLG